MDCSYCGEVAFLDLLEIWPAERAWMFETCCEESYYDVLEALETDEAREEVAELLREYGINVRRVYSSSIEFALRMDYNLELRDVDLKTAKAFVEEHHRHNKPPVSWRWGHAVYNGDDLIGVAMVGGDALFAGSIGRTDFHHSDEQTLLRNIREHLMSLPDETQVFSGHGPPTTIGRERASNPFLGRP